MYDLPNKKNKRQSSSAKNKHEENPNVLLTISFFNPSTAKTAHANCGVSHEHEQEVHVQKSALTQTGLLHLEIARCRFSHLLPDQKAGVRFFAKNSMPCGRYCYSPFFPWMGLYQISVYGCRSTPKYNRMISRLVRKPILATTHCLKGTFLNRNNPSSIILSFPSWST